MSTPMVYANQIDDSICLADFRVTDKRRTLLEFLYMHNNCPDTPARIKLLCSLMGQTWFPELDIKELERRYSYSHL